jgi:hypothetical protein
MKGLLTAVVMSVVAILIAFGSGATGSAASAFPAPQDQTLSCNSDDMRRHFCPADTRGGVQIVKQHSEAGCIFDRTWGYDDRGIWVDRGCRADFLLGGAGWNGWDNGYITYCASDDGGRHVCPTDTRGGIRLVRKRSDASCDFGRSWGYDRHGIWVDRGCRADFEIGGGDSGWKPGGEGMTTVTCSSDDMRRHTCDVDTRGGVQLIRQRSESDCIYRQTWGYDRGGIWVDRGCRADFEIGGDNERRPDEDRDRDRDRSDNSVTTMSCSSDDMRRHYCAADTRGGVRLTRQRSESRCIYDQTWGYDRGGIWVDRGCRADFQIGNGR